MAGGYTVMVVMGSSGSGSSTLAEVCAGLCARGLVVKSVTGAGAQEGQAFVMVAVEAGTELRVLAQEAQVLAKDLDMDPVQMVQGATPARILHLTLETVTHTEVVARGLVSGTIAEVLPLHPEPGAAAAAAATAAPQPSLFVGPWTTAPGGAVDDLRGYYGETVGMYFSWLSTYNTWLLGLAGMGALACSLETAESIHDSRVAPFYALATMLWGIAFLSGWSVTASRLSLRWDTLFYVPRSAVSPDFVGELRVSPITGEPEPYFSPAARLVRQLVSLAVTSVMLMGSALVMMASLNLQGYIVDRESWVYIPMLADLAKPGAVLDPESWAALGPPILHSVVINAINVRYRSVAAALVRYENHRTVSEAHNALVVKRVLFECFDAFLPLAYIAFVRFDLAVLQAELIALYSADEVRRVVIESLLPWAWARASAWMSGIDDDVDDDGVVDPAERYVAQAGRDPYDPFDDYLEQVLQYAYVVLFATALPAAGIIALASNLVEGFSDSWKLAHVHRRPVPGLATNIGPWATVLSIATWLAIPVNSMLFCFSSSQIVSLFAVLYNVDVGLLREQYTSGRLLMLHLMFVEHAAVLIGLALWSVLPTRDPEVVQAEQRREYQQELAVTKLRALAASSSLTPPPPTAAPPLSSLFTPLKDPPLSPMVSTPSQTPLPPAPTPGLRRSPRLHRRRR